MKSIIRTVVSTIVPLAVIAIGSTAHATTTTAYAAGDLFIGFRQAGNNSDYLVNIGQASLYTGATSTRTLTIGNIAADLSVALDSGWATDSNVSWGVVGTNHLTVTNGGNDPSPTLYASKISTGTGTTPWTCAFSLSTADSKITGMAAAYRGKTPTINSSVGLIQNNISTSSNNAYASYQPDGVNVGAGNLSFGYFNPTIEASSNSGITATTLNLYRVPEGSADPGTLVGSFTISADGSVTFTPAPSSPYNTWANTHSLSGNSALPTADPDNDGLQNMVEFVLGSDPNSGKQTNLPTLVDNGANLTFSFPHNAAAVAEYNVAVQTSTDLVRWTTQSAGTESGGIYTKVIPKNGATKMFARLNVIPK